MKNVLDYLEEHTIAVYENEHYLNERVYNCAKAAYCGSLYYNEMSWIGDVVFIKGKTVKEYYTAYAGKPDFQDIPLFKPEFNRHEND